MVLISDMDYSEFTRENKDCLRRNIKHHLQWCFQKTKKERKLWCPYRLLCKQRMQMLDLHLPLVSILS